MHAVPGRDVNSPLKKSVGGDSRRRFWGKRLAIGDGSRLLQLIVGKIDFFNGLLTDATSSLSCCIKRLFRERRNHRHQLLFHFRDL